MKFSTLFVPLLLLPLYAYAEDKQQKLLFQNTENQNTLTETYSNESEQQELLKSFTRSIDYPTQIIRMDYQIQQPQLTCAAVHEEINKMVVSNIATNQFSYAIYVSCHYDPQTYLATHFIISSYFDPIDDEAIAYLNDYLNEHNGKNLLGTPLKIESAKGLIISLSLAAGMKKNPDQPPFVEYRRDRSNFYFKNNYEMKNKLVTDIYENFFSNNAEKILPFLDRWIFANASILYKVILRDSNYVELQPERIFLMEDGDEIFISGLKQYFMHHCEKYENHRCLNPS